MQIFGFTALFPVTFVSNVFVQTETMPGWLQAWVKVNPVTKLSPMPHVVCSSAGRLPNR